MDVQAAADRENPVGFIASTSGRNTDNASTLTYLNVAGEAVAMTTYQNNSMWNAMEDRGGTAARTRHRANPDAARTAVKELETGPPGLYEGGNIKKAVAEIQKDLRQTGHQAGGSPEAADASVLQPAPAVHDARSRAARKNRGREITQLSARGNASYSA